MVFEVRQTVEADWRDYRAIRLEMLADAPSAFETTLASAEERDEAFWRGRAAGSDDVVTFAAVDASGRWLGCMTVLVEGGTPWLVGAYVTPEARGSGVADAVLAASADWASARGDALLLEVYDRNVRAIGFYLRSGFELTGRRRPHPRDPGDEVEMRMPLPR